MKSNEYNDITDKELLDLYQKDNNPEWIGILLERYTLLLLGVCMKYMKEENEAKDCVQQVFLKVLTDVSKYDIAFFKSWLYMVAKNHCLMRLREKGIKATKELTENINVVSEENNHRQLSQTDKAYDYLEESLNELNEEQRQCLILFYIKKCSYQEVCEKTGYQLMQVKSYIQNGKRNLRIILERKLKQSI